MTYEGGSGGRVADQGSGGGSFWTFDGLQERWVEAVQLWERMPDRERGWLAVRAFWPEIKQHGWRVDVDGEHDERPIDPPETRRPGLTRDEVASMSEAAEWLLLVPEDDRRVVVLGLGYLARGRKRIPWTHMLRRLGLRRGAHGLRKRYDRGVAVAVMRLNGMSEVQAKALARRGTGLL